MSISAKFLTTKKSDSNAKLLNRSTAFPDNIDGISHPDRSKIFRHTLLIVCLTVILGGGIFLIIYADNYSALSSKTLPIKFADQQSQALNSVASGSSASTSSTANNSQTPGSNSTNVTVNGQSIPVPDNGSYNELLNSGNSKTDVTINSERTSATSGSSASNNSSTSININQSGN